MTTRSLEDSKPTITLHCSFLGVRRAFVHSITRCTTGVSLATLAACPRYDRVMAAQPFFSSHQHGSDARASAQPRAGFLTRAALTVFAALVLGLIVATFISVVVILPAALIAWITLGKAPAQTLLLWMLPAAFVICPISALVRLSRRSAEGGSAAGDPLR